MGTPNYAMEILKGLIDSKEFIIPLVFTQPDKPIGRKKIITPPLVKVLALENSIEVLQPNSLRDKEMANIIKEKEPDFIVVAAYGQILPKDILDIAPCINLHASLLPKYRGASPIQQSLLNGDKTTGVTSMLMEEGLDTGDMLLKESFEIPNNMRLSELTQTLTQVAKDLTIKTLKEFDTITPKKQNENEASLCKKIKKNDGIVDLENAKNIYNKYRAFEGWPKIFFENGIKIEEVEIVEEKKEYKAFEVLEIKENSIVLGCKIGSISIGYLQPPSKKLMSAKAYCVGRGIKVGDNLF